MLRLPGCVTRYAGLMPPMLAPQERAMRRCRMPLAARVALFCRHAGERAMARYYA